MKISELIQELEKLLNDERCGDCRVMVKTGFDAERKALLRRIISSDPDDRTWEEDVRNILGGTPNDRWCEVDEISTGDEWARTGQWGVYLQ